jgi:hypothetical protein
MTIIDRKRRQTLRANLHTIFASFTITAAIIAALNPPACAQSIVPVSNVTDLYNAVNNPEYAGAQVLIEPGTYTLVRTFPNGGRVELQEGMSLVGHTSDPALVIIDASDLQSTTMASVRLGRGSNSVEWLTIQNNLVGPALIGTGLPPTSAPTHIRVAHVILENGQRGINFAAQGSAFNGQTIEGTFEDNVIRNIQFGMSQGIRVVLAQGVSGATMNVTLRNNLFSGNQIGLLAANLNSSTDTITIDSSGDQFVDNRAGCWLIGGIGPTSSSDVLVFTAHNDQFEENNRAQTVTPYTTGGGIVAMGAALQGHDNRTRLEVFDSHFSGNSLGDISVYGYYDPLSGAPGINNVLELRPSAVTPIVTPSDPPDPSNTNKVILLPPLRYQPYCTINGVNISNTSWNSFSIPPGSSPIVWAHAHTGAPRGISTTTQTTVLYTGVSLNVNGTSYPLPDGLTTFDPAAPATITTTFNAAHNRWETLANPNKLSDEIFFTGAAIPVTPAIAQSGRATWTFDVLSQSPTLSFSWQWSAAAYTFWPPDWNQASIQPAHSGFHAGTPLNTAVQNSLIAGPRGGGGSNYTGSWSATGTASCPTN